MTNLMISLCYFSFVISVSYLGYDRPNMEWLLFFGIIPRKHEEHTLNSTYDVTECLQHLRCIREIRSSVPGSKVCRYPKNLFVGYFFYLFDTNSGVIL